MNLRIANTFCTTSNEALCVLAGTIPIIIKVEELVNIHNIKNGEETKHTRHREVEPKYWQHPADDAKIIEAKEHKDQTIHSYMQNLAKGWIRSSNILWKRTCCSEKIQTG
jgi:hypothetical protein